MLIRFRVENFRSIKDEQELSLVATTLTEHPDARVHVERYDLDLLRTAAIYGPNASGKSTVLAALRFMRAAVVDSQRTWLPEGGVPREPFALDPECAKSPSRFIVDLLVDGVRYEYGFAVDSQRILEEWLFAFPKGRRQEWFTRDAGRSAEFTFSRLLPGENRVISGFTRPNSLFLSAAAQNNHPALAPLYGWFSRTWLLDATSRSAYEVAVAQLCMNEQWRNAVLSVMQAADLGVTGLEVVEEDIASFAGRFNRMPDDPELLGALPFGDRAAAGIRLRHRSNVDQRGIQFAFEQESEGTRTLFYVAGLVALALGSGLTLLIDELDRSLHPELSRVVVAMFNRPETNPQNAQLIFNTHDTNLLDGELLRRDQIWFTEKGDDGATRLFPLTDFRARKSENIQRGYLQGRYGAVPSVRRPDLQRTGS